MLRDSFLSFPSIVEVRYSGLISVCLNSCAILLTFFLCISVLVALYEQQEKPSNALEYPSIHKTTLCVLQKKSLCLVGSEFSLWSRLVLIHTNNNNNEEKCPEISFSRCRFFNRLLLRFVKQHLGAAGQASADTEALQQEVMDLRQRCSRLAEENKDLKTRVCFF